MSNSQQWRGYEASRNAHAKQRWTVSLKRIGGVSHRMVAIEASCVKVAAALAARLYSDWRVEEVQPPVRGVSMNNSNAFALAYQQAYAAGQKAAAALVPRPMVVVGGGKEYFVEDGVCGFAWVKVRPGNSPFARWLKAQGYAHKAYDGGVDIWISDYNQSMQKKEAHAHAMAEALREKLGGVVDIYADSRMD